MKSSRTTLAIFFLLIATLLLGGCNDNATEESEASSSSLLVGTWVWPEQVSTIEIDGDLMAVQTSVFDFEGAPPSRYTVIEDGAVIWLDGWFARNEICDPAQVLCDGAGRERLIHAMSYHVDEAVFWPFAMFRRAGADASGVEGVWEANLLTLVALPGSDAETVEQLELSQTWTLQLEADGRFTSTTTLIEYLDRETTPPTPIEAGREEIIESSAGRYSHEDGALVLQHGPSEAHPEGRRSEHRVDLDAGALSFETLIFERVD